MRFVIDLRTDDANRDQRLTEDIRGFSESICMFATELVLPGFVVYYSIRAWQTVGNRGVLAAFVAFIIVALISGYISGLVSRIFYRQRVAEGDLR